MNRVYRFHLAYHTYSNKDTLNWSEKCTMTIRKPHEQINLKNIRGEDKRKKNSTMIFKLPFTDILLCIDS